MAGVHDSSVPDLAAGEDRSAEIASLADPLASVAIDEKAEVSAAASVEVAEGSVAVASLKKRTRALGVRVIRGRVVDTENGISCHQCRQKTRDFAASCTNTWKGKPCLINICHKCLMNRYGQKIEEVEKIDNWCCPRCRGVCNCSLCMKKKGHIPTGNLVHTVKATGYSSVHDLLDHNGSDVLSALDGLKNSKGINSPAVEKALKRIRDKEHNNDRQKDNLVVNGNETPEVLSLENGNNEDGKESNNNDGKRNPQCHKGNFKKNNNCGNIDETSPSDVYTDSMIATDQKLAKRRKLDRQIVNTEIDLPKGAALLEVADTDWPVEDVGPVLQFLEFCNAFSKVLGLKDGEPVHLLRDLARGHLLRQVGSSSILHFLTKLFSLIQEDMDEKSISYSVDSGDIWLVDFVKFIEQSGSAFKKFEFASIPKDPLAFDGLVPSKKLKILNLLCDEALQTEKLRNWMDSENQKYIDGKKETFKIKSEAKKKGNDLKKKLKDDMAKAMMSANGGVPLSATEQSHRISQIKEESEKAQAEVLETMGTIPKYKQRRDSMRTDPVLCEEKGCVYWELEGYCNNSKILLQDVGDMSSTVLQDRWFSYSPEEEKIIEQHICSARRRRRWARKISKDIDYDNAQGYESDNVADGDHHSKVSELDNVGCGGHRAQGSEIAIDDHSKVCEAVADDDDQAQDSEIAIDDHSKVCEAVADDDHQAQDSEIAIDDHSKVCEAVAHDDHQVQGSEIAIDDHSKVCEAVADDDPQAKGSEFENIVGDDNRVKGSESVIIAGDLRS